MAVVGLGESKGYEPVATTDWIEFFVEKELYAAFNIADNGINTMYDPGQYETRLFQCYDGTMVIAGCKRLMWSNVTISQEDIQVLPPSLRNFGDVAS